MDFRFTGDQQDLIDAAKDVFDGENTVERMRAIARQETASELWPQLVELGLLGMMAPDSVGGLEQELTVMAGMAEAAGYAGVPEPIVEVAGIIIPILLDMGNQETVSKLLTGETTIAMVAPLLKYSNCAGYAEQLLLTNKTGGTLKSTASVTLEPVKSVDPLRWLSKIDEKTEDNALANANGAILTAAQLIGLSQRMVDMSVEYAKDRHQFGKPIGSFQAIKHHLATVYTQIEFTRPMVHLAALQGGRAVHTAKIAAIDTAMLAAETAIQVHGGMGYTFEVDLHLFMKRAWALCGEWGDRNYHMKKLEEQVLGGEADLGPGTTFAA